LVPLLILVPAALGGLCYYLLAIVFARQKRLEIASPANAVSEIRDRSPISLLKPLRGADATLAECLETFFQQKYPEYEILFAMRQPSDPAVAIIDQISARYPSIPVRLLFTDEPPYSNAKVYSMEKMAEQARYDILVITDSDASVGPDYLKNIMQCFSDPSVGAMTHLYRGVAGPDFWSRLEAVGMSTEFMAGVVVAERMEGMKFALGPSMAIRRDCLEKIGGFAAMADYLADDFVLGNWSHKAGYRVALSAQAINHHATSSGFRQSFIHRLRWNRSTRCSRPAGYIGQGFTYGTSWALLLAALFPADLLALSVLILTLTARYVLAREMSLLLQDKFAMRRPWLLLLQDLLSFASWVGGFSGREIVWRNERYRLLSDGRFEPVTPRQKSVLATD
jgi:ceramide glucosyltransferase